VFLATRRDERFGLLYKVNTEPSDGQREGLYNEAFFSCMKTNLSPFYAKSRRVLPLRDIVGELLARDGERYEILMKNESVNETRRESMSMHPQPIPAIPEETVRIAHAVLPKGNVWMQMRDELGTLYEDHDFQDLFMSRGQPAETPWRLALVTIMQYGEGLTDRQEALAVRTRIDWK
jgi:hypothetical protein